MVFRPLVGRTDVLGRKDMPRIAASLAVLLTAVTCIGFNTARYPAVWRMVAGGDGLAQSDRSDDPAAALPSPAAPQSESLAQSPASAESAASWYSDWQSDDDQADSTDWESTMVEPNPAYASYEDGSSYHDSDESSLQYSNRNSYRYSDEGSYDSGGGWDDTNTASSPGYAQDELAGSDDYDPYPSDDDDSAASGGYESWGNDDGESVERVGMRKSSDHKTTEPERNLSQSRFDPVAPQPRPATSRTSYHGCGEHASDSDRTDAYGSEANASENAAISPSDDPVKAPAAARYASYASGTYGDSPDHSPASPGDTMIKVDAHEAGEADPRGSLVPVKPAQTDCDGGESLARRPWGNSLSLPDRVGSSGSSEVIPLPPVDEVSRLAGSEPRPTDTEDAIRIYPTTGVE
jgi:hypothetical protein